MDVFTSPGTEEKRRVTHAALACTGRACVISAGGGDAPEPGTGRAAVPPAPSGSGPGPGSSRRGGLAVTGRRRRPVRRDQFTEPQHHAASLHRYGRRQLQQRNQPLHTDSKTSLILWAKTALRIHHHISNHGFTTLYDHPTARKILRPRPTAASTLTRPPPPSQPALLLHHNTLHRLTTGCQCAGRPSASARSHSPDRGLFGPSSAPLGPG